VSVIWRKRSDAIALDRDDVGKCGVDCGADALGRADCPLPLKLRREPWRWTLGRRLASVDVDHLSATCRPGEPGHLIARQTILDSTDAVVKNCAMALPSEVSDS
jgi:hypothetical protein